MDRKTICVPFKLVICIMVLFSSYAYAGEGGKENTAAGRSKLDERLLYEISLKKNPFVLVPYKQNYFIADFNDVPNNGPFSGIGHDLDKAEIKFQLSFKVPFYLKSSLENGLHSVEFGYTQQSYWQLFDFEHSAPFRETNYAPELMLTFLDDTELLFGLKSRIIKLGPVLHQSNGQSGTLSRSWNRSYAEFILESGKNFYMSIKPWFRWKENKNVDENPDIDKYLGNGELLFVYTWDAHIDKKAFPQVISLLIRNNLHFDSVNRGAIQFDYSIPFTKVGNVKFYVQYYRGYGESLIDYNHNNNRIGAGVLLTNWL